jgi:hypothetical protein
MESPKPLTNDDGEVRELTEEDFARMVRFSALPAELQALLSEPRHLAPDAEKPESHEPAA